MLDGAGVPAARVRGLDEVLAGAQVAAREITRPVEIPGAAAPVHLPTLGFKADGEAIGPSVPPPRLGADTDRLINSTRSAK